MRQVMARYTTHPDRADENAALIRDVFDALRATAPDGLTYASYRLDDGVSCVHVASIDDTGSNSLTALSEFKAFTAGVKDRCEVPPSTTVLHEVGSYQGAHA